MSRLGDFVEFVEVERRITELEAAVAKPHERLEALECKMANLIAYVDWFIGLYEAGRTERLTRPFAEWVKENG